MIAAFKTPENPARVHAMKVLGIGLFGFPRETPGRHLEPGRTKRLMPQAGNSRIGIFQSGDDVGDSRLEDRGDAGRGAPLVGARFERDVERGALGFVSRLAQRVNLRVRAAGTLMEALADDTSLPDDDRRRRSDSGSAASRAKGQLERAAHPGSRRSGDPPRLPGDEKRSLVRKEKLLI